MESSSVTAPRGAGGWSTCGMGMAGTNGLKDNRAHNQWLLSPKSDNPCKSYTSRLPMWHTDPPDPCLPLTPFSRMVQIHDPTSTIHSTMSLTAIQASTRSLSCSAEPVSYPSAVYLLMILSSPSHRSRLDLRHITLTGIRRHDPP